MQRLVGAKASGVKAAIFATQLPPKLGIMLVAPDNTSHPEFLPLARQLPPNLHIMLAAHFGGQQKLQIPFFP